MDALIQAGLLLALVVSPLYFNPRTQHTFEPDKAALLRSVILIAVLAWVARHVAALFRQQTRTEMSEQESIGSRLWAALSKPLVVPALLLLLAYVLGTVTSVLPRVSVWGGYERDQGLFTLITYVAIFFLVREAVSSAQQREQFVDVILLVSVPISAYAILQHFGLDPLNFQTGGAAVTSRAISTLGNPIFLGAYLLMVFPLTIWRIYQAWSASPDKVRVGSMGLYGALGLLQLVAFFFAQSRGPVVGLIIGGVPFGVVLWAARRRARRLLVFVGVLVVVGGITLSLLPALVPATSPLGRLTQLVDLTSRTGRQRLLVWEGVVDSVAAEPGHLLLGYGPETLRDVINPHLPAEIASLKPDEDFDRAHNAVLDLWASTGLLGVVAYLLVVGAVLYHGVGVLGFLSDERDHWRFLGFTLAGTVVGGLVPWLGVGRQWVGVGLPLGLLGGVTLFVFWEGVGSREHQSGRLPAEELLVIAFLAAIVGHVVETLVGIAIVATQVLFWVYAAFIGILSGGAEERRSGGAGGQGSRGAREQGGKGAGEHSSLHLRTSAPLHLGTVWGGITGITLALFAFPLLTAGQMRGAIAWGVVASVTVLYGLLHVAVGREDEAEELTLRYVGVIVGAAVLFLILFWLPWPPTDISHSTVAVFAYVLLAFLGSAVVFYGIDLSRLVVRQLTWEQGLAFGILAISAIAVIWMIDVRPIRADVFYKEGLGLSAAGDLQTSARFLELSVNTHPREDRYHSGAGAAYAQMAQVVEDSTVRDNWLAQAESYLQAARRLDPYRADHLRNLGLLHQIWAGLSSSQERTVHLRHALEYYAQAAARNPVSVRIWREWGDIHAALGEWEEANQRYEESLRLNEGFVDTWLALANARLQQGNYAGAVQAYREALTLDEDRVLQSRQAAVTRSPDDPQSHQALALVYAALGDKDAAQAEADAARSLMDAPPPAWDQFLEALQ